MKKLFGFNLDVELKERLNVAAKKKYTNSSILLNQILSVWLDEFENIPQKEKIIIKPVVQTEEERLEDWEWRKGMVAQGKFPVHMGEEYPVVEDPNRKDVYLTPENKTVSKSQEDADFEESLAKSLVEKE